VTQGVTPEYFNLGTNPMGEQAAVMILRGGVNIFLGTERGADWVLQEQISLKPYWDTQYYDTRRQKVLNKHARHNLCFASFDQAPNYPEGQGRVIDFNHVYYTRSIRDRLPYLFGPKATNLLCEANYYNDVYRDSYIGFHGDKERLRIIGCRFGQTMPFYFQWFYQNKAIGEKVQINLNHGDIYIMSQKAVGNDWKRSSQYTLRHAAGFEGVLKKVGQWKE
jgi:hypothetical protein